MAIEHLIMLIDARTLANLGMSAKLYFGDPLSLKTAGHPNNDAAF
jgi:hypothetical protein